MTGDQRQDRDVLFGREAELETLQALVERGGGLVTVTGPPGMGKTCLVRRFAQAAIQTGRLGEEGVFFCDLSQAWSVADIVTNVSAALGTHLSGSSDGTSTVELLGQALAGRGSAVVILDNFEQLVSHAPETVSQWIRLAPEATFLVTSRDRLRLRSETVLSLPPLPVDAAVALFSAAASQAQGGVTLKGDEESAVRELVQRLDGIPLAIELAAARTGVMSARRMLDRIGRRFQLLGHGPSDGVARQATLRAAIDWSWELLEENERDVMAQCSVFRGGFSLDAAEAVVALDGDDDVLDLLESLHRKSLIYTRRLDHGDGEMGFAIYESIRDYAGEHLGEDCAGPQARHAAFFIERGEAQIDEFGSPEGTDLGWLKLNRDNLMAAAQIHKESAPDLTARAILALAHAQIRRGPYDSLLDMLASVPQDQDRVPEVAARLAFAQGVALSILGRSEEAEVQIERARQIAQDNDLVRMGAKARLHLGLNQLRIGQLDAARSHLELALAEAEAAGLERIQARTLASTGMAHEASAGFAEAERCYQEAGAIARRVGDAWEEARSRSKMGTLCGFMKDRQDEARGHLEWALERSISVGDQFIAATTSYNLGRLELNLGHLEDAEEHLCHALVEYRDMANRVSEGFVRLALGLLHLDRGETDSSRAELELARDRLAAISHPLAQAYCDLTLAMAALTENQLASAKRHSQAAMSTVVAAKHRVLEGISASVCGLVSFAEGDPEGCQGYRDQARGCLADSGWGEGMAMLTLVDAVAESTTSSPPSLPAMDALPYARARVGWRIVSQQVGGTGAEEEPDVQQVSADTGAHPDALLVGDGGRWFRPPGGSQVDLTRKRTLRPMLLLLAEHRLTSPGEAMDVNQIFSGVWPGERALPRARKNRVYVSIATLRKMGLDTVLTTRGDGYLFRPDVAVVIDD